MNLFSVFVIVALIQSINLMYAMTNLILHPLRKINKLFIFLYIAFCQICFGQFFGQSITYFAIGGALFIIAASEKIFFANCVLALIGYVFSISVNYILISLMSLFGISVNAINGSDHKLIIFVIVYTLIVFFSTYYIGKYIRSLHFKNYLFVSKKIQFLFSLEIFICTFIFMFNIIQGEQEGYPTKIVYFNTFLFSAFFIITLVIFFFCLKIMQKNQELESIQKEKLALEDYTNKLEMLYQNMRIFKHDYVNLLSTMQFYINDEDTETLKEFFKTKILPSSELLSGKDAIISRLSNIKVLELKGILYAKLLTAMNQNLDITLEIKYEINRISMDLLDLSTVIGAFLDNAIEASLESEVKELLILIIQTTESTTIVISNSTADEEIKLDTIYDKDITSKKDHSGLGLYSSYKILNKYNNIIHTTNFYNLIFTQTLEICSTN